jgi:hypothetical protein
MVSSDTSEGKKNKPRGRPFQQGNRKGKLENQILDIAGLEKPVKGGVIETNDQNAIGEPEKKEYNKENNLDSELIETLEFKNGENTLTIRLLKKMTRMFRIQVMLNEKTEIRPVTYVGSSTAYCFWNMLKDSLKK